MARLIIVALSVIAFAASTRDSLAQTEGRRRDPFIRLSQPYLSPDVIARQRAFVESATLVNMPVSITMGLSEVVRTRFPISRISIVDPKVVEVVQHGPREVEFMGEVPRDERACVAGS